MTTKSISVLKQLVYLDFRFLWWLSHQSITFMRNVPLGNKRNKKRLFVTVSSHLSLHPLRVVILKPILLVCIINYSSCIPYGTCILSWNKVENDTYISSFTSSRAGCKDVLQLKQINIVSEISIQILLNTCNNLSPFYSNTYSRLIYQYIAVSKKSSNKELDLMNYGYCCLNIDLRDRT